jgi:hypothetical protein
MRLSVFAVIVAVLPCVAAAHYPGGWDGGDSPEHTFWDCHMLPGVPPTSCCGTSNGFYLEADQWRVITDGNWSKTAGRSMTCLARR